MKMISLFAAAGVAVATLAVPAVAQVHPQHVTTTRVVTTTHTVTRRPAPMFHRGEWHGERHYTYRQRHCTVRWVNHTKIRRCR